jgi:hypothetical protein
MKKLLFGTILLAVLIVYPIMSMAQVNVRVNVPIPLPPPIPFVGPPNVVVLPGTDVYAVPDVNEELFFRQGWWWRNYGGHWYRSQSYDRGWAYYRGYPSWYRGIPHDWRDNYRNNTWGGHPWNHTYIRHADLNNHWRGHAAVAKGGGRNVQSAPKGGGRNVQSAPKGGGRNVQSAPKGGGRNVHGDEKGDHHR